MAKISYFILFLLALVLASPLFLSRIMPDGSMLINGAGDNLWHISLAAEVKKQIPPSFPGITGVQLKNYHYFGDLIWGVTSKISGIPLPTLYFQIGSIIVCFILIYLIFKLAYLYSKSNFWSIICVLTTLFVGSAAILKPFFIKGSSWKGNNFLLDQPYDQLINLHTGIGYILIILGTIFMFKWFSTKKIKYSFYSAIIFSLLFGFKTFFAIPIALSFGIICLLELKETNFKSLLPVVLLGVLSIIIFLSISDKTSLGNNSPVIFRPGWLLTKMVEDSERFNLDGYYLKQLHYESKNNWLRLTQMEIEKITIFILGNFWIKLFGLVYLIKSYRKFHKENRFVLICIFISMVLPMIIVPQQNPFDAVQFGQVAIIFLGLFLGLFISTQKNKIAKIFFILLIPFLLLSFYKDFFNSAKFKEYIVSKDEITALHYLKANSETNATVMVDPEFNNSRMKVTALAERRTFYSGGNIARLLSIDNQSRSIAQNQFFLFGIEKNFIDSTIKDGEIDYIYTTTTSEIINFGYPVMYSNPSVTIYETKQ